MIWPFITWARGAVIKVEALPHWAYQMRGHKNRLYPPRSHGNDVWVQTGDLRDDTGDPNLDTWEGEAT